jgi:hypothetical protein
MRARVGELAVFNLAEFFFTCFCLATFCAASAPQR